MRKLHALALTILLTALLAATSVAALAQPHGARPERLRPDGGGRMSGEERQRLREDLQHHQAERRQGGGDAAGEDRARRYAEWQRLSPEQREGIRREMRDTNRDFDRRR